MMELDLNGLAECSRFASLLAGCVPTPMVIALDGTLGAGKTAWTRCFAEACGVDEREITSPTFVLVHRYAGVPPIFHIDAYRVRDEDEFLELGVEEMFESDSITIIEWGMKVQDCLPKDRIHILLEVVSENGRLAKLEGTGVRGRDAVEKFARLWNATP